MGISILIGSNCSKALELLEVISSKYVRPYAFGTLLSWCIVVPIGESARIKPVIWNRIEEQKR